MKTAPEGAHYVDYGPMESSILLVCLAQDEDGLIHEERNYLTIPEDTMDALEDLLGDANATVTVGKEIKVSENYKTVSSACYVKLTCNQSVDKVLETREAATSLALGFAEQGYARAKHILDRMQGIESEEPEPLLVDMSPPPKKKTQSKGGEPGRRQKSRPVLKGKNKPTFRR